jgi:hypothetical protein
MFLYNLIIENKELIKIFYALIIILICTIIVIKIDKLFRLSLHQGIRYLRNAFFFYGIGFIIRYFFSVSSDYNFIATIIFKYFFVMAGFFLLYSLLWKKIEPSGDNYYSSFFNANIFIFYAMSFVIVFLDYLWKTSYLLFYSQIILFTFISIIAYINYRKNGRRHKFLKFYFIAMMLSLTVWLLNALGALLLNWNKGVSIIIYLLNMIIFLLFLYGVIKLTKIK